MSGPKLNIGDRVTILASIATSRVVPPGSRGTVVGGATLEGSVAVVNWDHLPGGEENYLCLLETDDWQRGDFTPPVALALSPPEIEHPKPRAARLREAFLKHTD